MSDAADPVVRIDGLAVRCFGPPDAPPVLLSAGLGGSGAYWMPQVAALADRYRVILYDHRGTGASARDSLPERYAVADLAADMRILLDGLGIASAHVVGHAASAVAGLELAATAPERVRSLTVVNGWAASDPHFRRCMAIRRDLYRAGGAAAYVRAQPLFLFPADWISRNLDRLDAEAAGHVAHFQSEATLFARIAALEAFDFRGRLDRVGCPVLLVVSGDDMLVPPAAADALAAGLPDVETVRFAWGGHAVNVTMPDAFDAALGGFLDRHEPPRNKEP